MNIGKKLEKMKKIIQNFNKIIKDEHIITKGSLKISVIILLVLVVLSIIFYLNTIAVINDQIKNINDFDLQSNTEIIENIFREVENIVNYTITSDKMQIFFSSNNPKLTDEIYDLDIKNTFKPFILIYRYINSIYIYTDVDKNICTVDGYVNSEEFFDDEWLEVINRDTSQTSAIFYPRVIGNKYPYVVTYIKQFTINGNKCAVAANIDLDKLYDLFDTNEVLPSFYMINGSKIIYNTNMEKMFEDIENNDELSKVVTLSYDSSLRIKNHTGKYVVSIKKSQKYDWSYVYVNTIDKYSNDIVIRKNIFILLTSILLILGVLLIYKYNRSIYEPINAIEKIIDSESEYEGKFIPEIRKISEKIINYSNVNKALKIELENRLYELQNLQLQVLKAQVSPHFIYNSLYTIYMQSIQDFNYNHITSKMILNLSKYLKYSLKNGSDTVLLEEEIENSKIYLDLFKNRYDEIKEVNWKIDSKLNGCSVLKLCLQPIIENSVYHGISASCRKDGIISILCNTENDMLIFTITDNGIGMTEDELQKIISKINSKIRIESKHIGIRNLHQRIQLMYGEKYGLEIKSEYGKGTTVKIKLPIIK